MSNYAPGWYPDGSGRYAQRYYDGSSWTEHVLDHSGQSALDPVAGVTVPQGLSTAPIPSISQPAAASQQAWGRSPTSDAHQARSGTSSSSFEFGAAPTHDRADPAAAPGPTAASMAAGGFRPTVGVLAAGGGLVLAGLAVLVLAYWSGDGLTVTLGDISDASSNVNGVAGSYASFGRWIGLVAMIGVVAITVLDELGNAGVVANRSRLTIAAAVAGGTFGLWHLVGLFVAPDPGGPAIAGFVGVIGYVAGAASGYLRKPVGGSTR